MNKKVIEGKLTHNYGMAYLDDEHLQDALSRFSGKRIRVTVEMIE